MEINEVLSEYRSNSRSEREKGEKFERLMQSYLLTDPLYANQFQKVWLWNEFPSKNDFGGKDIGIDLVACTTEGEYWAIQCKFYGEDKRISKDDVDSFLSTSGKSFKVMVDEKEEKINFSKRLFISTTNNWGVTARETLENQTPQVSILNFNNLMEANVDWKKLNNGIFGEQAKGIKKELRQHQNEALEKTCEYFKNRDRGQLIMACGTGKTFTSLKIAENETNGEGLVLFLVPSIALLGQTLREWSNDAEEVLNAICICSDPKSSRKTSKNNDNDGTSIIDLALPASTNVDNILKQLEKIKNKKGLKVVFSTYQSINVIAEAQKKFLEKNIDDFGVFDLIICDEAHRTTGVTLSGNDESFFVKVHDNDFIISKKRLYMTATPRLYGESSKIKANENDHLLCSMDDEAIYGSEIYRIGFGRAVEEGLLCDYKVLILTLSEKDIPLSVQRSLSGDSKEISMDDAAKLAGCINALSKQILGDGGILRSEDFNKMKKALAFCNTIKNSKEVTNVLNKANVEYIETLDKIVQSQMVKINSKHIDGSMNASQRDELVNWLKSDSADKDECKILTNVRCLSEGVDVPSLDAVLFISAKNSEIEVVQSVGRVMRTSKLTEKKYGYIIIPVFIPSDIKPEIALNDNKKYAVVWTVLNALRAHDDRFNSTINQMKFNENKPKNIIIGTPDNTGIPTFDFDGTQTTGEQFSLKFGELQGYIYAKIVDKVGDRHYWENWAKDIATVAENQIARITN
ncbi:MAG: DEAD/DEAH box helicase family protein, partial [Clostridium sp.]